MASHLPDEAEARALKCPPAFAPGNDGEGSHGNETCFEVLFWNWQVVGLEGGDVGLDSFPNVRKHRFVGFALGHTAG